MLYEVITGLVDSLARPGRNVTGLAWFADESIYVKRYQLLRELAPHAARVGTILHAPVTMHDTAGRPADRTSLADRIGAATHRMGLRNNFV